LHQFIRLGEGRDNGEGKAEEQADEASRLQAGEQTNTNRWVDDHEAGKAPQALKSWLVEQRIKSFLTKH